MPIYEYKCSGCGHQEEFLQKLSDPPQTRCPACGQETFSKMVTAAGFQLKGSGWYVTDFRGSGAGKATGKPTGASSGESSGESKSGEAKSGESTSSESKSSESKSGESKPAAAKSESKPAAKPAGTGTAGD